MRVTIHRILTGPAAECGAVRIDYAGEARILLAVDLTLEEQADLIAELLEGDDYFEYAEVIIPQQRVPVDVPAHLAAG